MLRINLETLKHLPCVNNVWIHVHYALALPLLRLLFHYPSLPVRLWFYMCFVDHWTCSSFSLEKRFRLLCFCQSTILGPHKVSPLYKGRIGFLICMVARQPQRADKIHCVFLGGMIIPGLLRICHVHVGIIFAFIIQSSQTTQKMTSVLYNHPRHDFTCQTQKTPNVSNLFLYALKAKARIGTETGKSPSIQLLHNMWIPCISKYSELFSACNVCIEWLAIRE